MSSIMHKIRRIFPMKQVDVKGIEQKSKEKQQTIYKYLGGSNKKSTETTEDGMINGEYEILEREIHPEKIVCPDCGGITLEGLEFCDKCGGDLRGI